MRETFKKLLTLEFRSQRGRYGEDQKLKKKTVVLNMLLSSDTKKFFSIFYINNFLEIIKESVRANFYTYFYILKQDKCWKVILES